jgi:hypothetical protein
VLTGAGPSSTSEAAVRLQKFFIIFKDAMFLIPV